MFVKGGGSLEQVGSRSQRAYRPQGSTRKSYRRVFIEPIVVPWALCIKWAARDPQSMNNQHLAKKTKNSKTTKKPKKNDLPQNPQWETTIHAYGPQVNIYRIKRPNDQLGTNRVGHIYIYIYMGFPLCPLPLGPSVRCRRREEGWSRAVADDSC